MSGPIVREVAAPAKVNLGLRVVGVRPDGYHELESVFVPLDLCDALRVAVHEGEGPAVALALTSAPGVPGQVTAGPDNLAARAASAFLARAGLRARVEIALTKRIPSPGGLGGGSSDAGAVLRALAACFPGALAGPELRALALSLGADVPFFLGPDGRGPVPARVSGIGEEIAPLAGVPALCLALVHPGQALETARVYAEFDAAAGLPGPGGAPTMPALSGQPAWRSPEWLSQQLANDLEPAAMRLCPAIAKLREALAASGAWAVGLSGSGPTLFGIFPDAPAASRALEGGELRAWVSGGSAGSPGWAGVARTAPSRASG